MDNVTRTRERINPRKLKTRELLLFACVPAPICRDPFAHDLKPLELAVAGTLLSLARIANATANYGKAFEYGGSIIDREAENHSAWRKEWRKVKGARRRGEYAPAPQRFHAYRSEGTYQPVKIKQAMRNAGTLAFQHAMKRLRGLPLREDVVLSVTRSELLRQVGLSNCADNLNAMDAALATLAGVIRIDRRLRLPVITIDRSPAILTITVSSAWANMQYHRVPLPLPTKSPLATQLLLWLHSVGGVKDERATKKSSDYKTFFKMFGFSTTWRANEGVNRALYYLNDNYFPRLNKLGLRAFGIKPPDAIEIVADDDACIKIVGLTAGTFRYDQAMERGRDSAPAKGRGSAMPRLQKVEDLRD